MVCESYNPFSVIHFLHAGTFSTWRVENIVPHMVPSFIWETRAKLPQLVTFLGSMMIVSSLFKIDSGKVTIVGILSAFPTWNLVLFNLLVEGNLNEVSIPKE